MISAAQVHSHKARNVQATFNISVVLDALISIEALWIIMLHVSHYVRIYQRTLQRPKHKVKVRLLILG